MKGSLKNDGKGVFEMRTLKEARIIELPTFFDARGNLSFAEQFEQIPFEIHRTYWIYDVPGGEMRGGHAFVNNQEVIIALSGSFDVVVSDGDRREVFSLNRSYFALYVPNGLWRSLENFSTNSVALELGSEPYDGTDYIRDFDVFMKLKRDGKI